MSMVYNGTVFRLNTMFVTQNVNPFSSEDKFDIMVLKRPVFPKSYRDKDI